jgi:hypothetical protein
VSRRPLIVALVALLLPAPAAAGPEIDAAVEALRDDPVYVDPEADPGLSSGDAERLRDRIADEGEGPIYVAVLPSGARGEAGGSAVGVIDAIEDGLRREGVYAVVVGGQFRAGSTDLDRGEAGALAEDAFAEHRSEGVAATLLDFVDRVGDARTGEGGGGDDGGGDSIAGLILLGLGGAGVAAYAVHRSRKRRRQQAELAVVKQAAQEDLLALADDIRELDLDVELPNADARGKEDYAQAVASYERADRALDRARTPEEMEPVSAALEEGRFAMASAKARLAGREPPERTAPCFFDPRHGPSVAEVEWAPPGGEPRPVPVCAADLARIEDGLEPASRELEVGGRRVPYWDAPPAFGPYAGGFFGGAAGLFPALFVGSLLGSAIFPGPAFGGSEGGGDEYGDQGDFDGDGDFGGGDFGGGDFGGGDFGGGDFGGGE